ncbi:MAG: type II toxin-antitoxin system HicA family toxin [Acidobacteria bacterium]|nr:type II toxin-antitoxin system HicA family toxin [Acidobacteriota bacterium]MBV9187966.1 type II toxin-antitoxin system HicA family toxin [Acidobacteriota bacterium]
MKRRDLIRHLREHGCVLDHEGGRHSVFSGPSNTTSTVPRHNEIKNGLVRKICSDLDIPDPFRRN